MMKNANETRMYSVVLKDNTRIILLFLQILNTLLKVRDAWKEPNATAAEVWRVEDACRRRRKPPYGGSSIATVVEECVRERLKWKESKLPTYYLLSLCNTESGEIL